MSNKIGALPILTILLATFVIISSQSSEAYANTNSSLPKSGDIIVPDFGSNGSFILSIDPQNGSQTKITTGGVQTPPGAVTVDDKGIIYILQMEHDSGAIQIFKFNPSTGTQDIVSSGGFLGINYMSELPNIYGITTDSSGNILVTDASGKIIKIDSITGNQSIIFSDTKLVGSFDIEIANNGDYIVSTWGGWASDFSSSAIIRISPITGSISVVSSNGTLTDGGG